jgi:putative flippase GtrA
MTAAQGFTRRFHSQLALYLVVGAIGFGVDAGAYLLFAYGWDWPLVPARLAAFLPATLVTWLINRHLTFVRGEGAATGPVLEYLRYLAVQGTGIVVSFVTFRSLVAHYPGHDFLALAAGSAIALALNFAGSRWLVFSGREGHVAVPAVIAFGALSLVLGQDTNWDLFNYHLYNPWAFLSGRLGTDLAAAGMQTYFNPLLDLPYYWMAMMLPAPAVAFAMGCAHGLAIVFVAGVARRVLPSASNREIWLLAAAGCLGAAFLSGLGTTMGDSTTAVLVLAALLVCLHATSSLGTRHASVLLVAAGLLVGAATGLKPTNAVYAVGLAAAVLVARAPLRQRLVALCALTAGGVAGLLATAGFWFWTMWRTFGNPLFPQFNKYFGSEMAAPVGVGDPRWGPRGFFEALGWPFVFTADPMRWAEIQLVQLLWPVAYALVIAWATRALWMRTRHGAAGESLPGAARMLLAFLATSYLLWMLVFGIGRYTIALEVFLPLLVWLLAQQLWPQRAAVARRAAVAAIAVAVAFSVVTFRTWGHASYVDRSYTVPVPPIREPARATVVLIAQPVAWMAVFFPPELAYVSMFNFPESPGFMRRVRQIIDTRGGDVWAVLPAATDTTARNVQRFNERSLSMALAADGIACKTIRGALSLSSRYRAYPQRPGLLCLFDTPPGEQRDLAAEDRATARKWVEPLRERGLHLDASSCARHQAAMGGTPQPYQFCRVTR